MRCDAMGEPDTAYVTRLSSVIVRDVPSLKWTTTASKLVYWRLPISAAGLSSGISVERAELRVSPVGIA